jgi:hypothetical protein
LAWDPKDLMPTLPKGRQIPISAPKWQVEGEARKEAVADWQCTVYTLVNQATIDSPRGRGLAYDKAEIWATTIPKLDPKPLFDQLQRLRTSLAPLLEIQAQMPQPLGVPVRLVITRRQPPLKLAMNMLSCRAERYQAHLFEVPQGYTQRDQPKPTPPASAAPPQAR